jgi:crotonobetainyl-CoA:carnitine CoA-transferase CaiB-like acyl-CoA transferase
VVHAGPTIGQHNDQVYGALGLSAAEIATLKARKVI